MDEEDTGELQEDSPKLAGKRGREGNQRKKLKPEVEDVIEKVTEQIFDEIDELRDSIDQIRHPRGTKESPARSCRDIKLGFPEKTDGRLCYGCLQQ